MGSLDTAQMRGETVLSTGQVAQSIDFGLGSHGNSRRERTFVSFAILGVPKTVVKWGSRDGVSLGTGAS